MTKILIKYGGNLLKRTGSLFTGYEGAPTTNFNASGSTASQVTITVGNSINFYDTSIKNPTSWSWNFGNGTPSTSTVQNPTGITFSTTGTTTVSLTTSNSYGSNTNTKTNYINVQPVQLNKIAINLNAAPLGGLGASGYTSGYTWTPSGMTQRSWTWNMFASNVPGIVPTIGAQMGLVYTDNTPSNYRVVISSNFSAAYNNGVRTGNDTGIYPDDIIQYSLLNYSYSPMVLQIVSITGLTTSITYKITVMGDKPLPYTATARYTITGGTSKDGVFGTLLCDNNTMNTVSITGVYPSSTGIIQIGLDYTNAAGYMNAIEIDEGG